MKVRYRIRKYCRILRQHNTHSQCMHFTLETACMQPRQQQQQHPLFTHSIYIARAHACLQATVVAIDPGKFFKFELLRRFHRTPNLHPLSTSINCLY